MNAGLVLRHHGFLPKVAYAVMALPLFASTTSISFSFAQTPMAAAPAEPIPTRGIPSSFKSWSLFLICDPSWLMPQSQKSIENLYEEFLAYGDAIGPEHVAVWFWSVKPDALSRKGRLDVERNTRLCASLKLPPSKSPYLIFTTSYPGQALSEKYPQTFPSMASLKNRAVLSLNGASAADTTRILSKLADELIEDKISHVPIDSSEFWTTWQKDYEAVRDEITGLVSRVTVTFDTGFFKTEVKLSKE